MTLINIPEKNTYSMLFPSTYETEVPTHISPTHFTAHFREPPYIIRGTIGK